jgi:predicted PurR-regulated permease PerM
MKKPLSRFIPLPKAAKTSSAEQSSLARLVSQDEFKKHQRILNWTFVFVVAALAICFTTFILLIVDVWKFHSTVIEKNSNMIERLEKENQESRIQELTKRIEELEKQKTANNTLESKTK